MSMITVANKKTFTGAGGHVAYIGRSRAGEPRNPLGNPFPVTGKGRWTPQTEAACTLLLRHAPDFAAQVNQARAAGGFEQGGAAAIFLPYLRAAWQHDADIRAALTALADLHRRGTPITLVCWCAPNPCHGDAVAQAIRGIAALERA